MVNFILNMHGNQVNVCFTFLVNLFKRGRMQTSSSEYKLVKPISWVECHSYHLTSYKKSVLTQKSSAQIPKAVNQDYIAGKTMKVLGKYNLVSKCCDNILPKNLPGS